MKKTNLTNLARNASLIGGFLVVVGSASLLFYKEQPQSYTSKCDYFVEIRDPSSNILLREFNGLKENPVTNYYNTAVRFQDSEGYNQVFSRISKSIIIGLKCQSFLRPKNSS